MQRPSNNPTGYLFGNQPGYPLNNGFHKGVDFLPNPDNIIYAPEDGVYTLSPNDGTLGNAIYCTVGNRKHAFGHTSKYLASGFQKRGTPLAVMGATGAADGVHLHWALTVNGQLVDPLSQVNEPFKGEDMQVTEDEFYQMVRAYLRREPTVEEAKGMTRDFHTLHQTLWNNGGKQNYEADKQPKEYVPYVLPQLYVKK